ncbi:hypothetical protein AD998_11600 [bacterium 336/3]|nr:hypothetical protein AD998_11600 [bacterium 336/3]
MLKKYYSKYGGILVGGLYGLLMRIVFELNFTGHFADLFSITFVWLLPIVIGLIPLIFSPKEELNDWEKRVYKPVLSVLVFFVLCYWTGREDIICIIIISIPFLIMAGFSGFILGSMIMRYRKKNGIMYSVLLFPFISGLIEPNFSTPKETFQTTSSIIIKANKAKIWKNIIRVDTIQETEYKKGFFNYLGIPRPLFAELDKDTLQGTRIGHFEGGLKFQENIIKWDKNNFITFDIQIIPSTTNRTIFERHILNEQHFKFLSATYKLNEINNEQTELLLITEYQLDTNINFYGEFWGKQLLTDFQERLIGVIKNRCEK